MSFPFLLEAEAIRQHTGSAGSFFTLKQYKKQKGREKSLPFFMREQLCFTP